MKQILPLTLGILGGLFLFLVRRTSMKTLAVDSNGWIQSSLVKKVPIHQSWYGDALDSKIPIGIVAHYTATDADTGLPMAKRRTKPKTPEQRSASWHLTIEQDGSVIQMIPLLREGWHVAKGKVKGFRVNGSTIGIELVGHGDKFTKAQVDSAKKIWRAIVQTYNIRPEFAMLQHSQFDPSRRSDPGPLWMNSYADAVVKAAYA